MYSIEIAIPGISDHHFNTQGICNCGYKKDGNPSLCPVAIPRFVYKQFSINLECYFDGRSGLWRCLTNKEMFLTSRKYFWDENQYAVIDACANTPNSAIKLFWLEMIRAEIIVTRRADTRERMYWEWVANEKRFSQQDFGIHQS